MSQKVSERYWYHITQEILMLMRERKREKEREWERVSTNK